MADWAVGLSTGCLSSMRFVDSLEVVRKAGFDMVEVCSLPQHLDYHDESALQGAALKLEELWMEAHSFHAPFAPDIDITSPERARRNAARDEIQRAAAAAAILGTKYFILHPGPETGEIPRTERMGRMGNAAGVLEEVAERCRELGVRLVLENMLPHLFAGPIRDLLWLLGSLARTDVGICLDTGHAHLAGDLERVAHKLSGHLWSIHVNDNRNHRDDHLPPGDGAVDWETLLRQLDHGGYRGALILEIAGSRDTDAVMAAAQRGRQHLRRMARRLDD